jgi:hypothetical protein
MTEPTHLFQFETDAPYEKLMLDRLASRETSQQMVKAVLGEDILRELGMLSKQSALLDVRWKARWMNSLVEE